MINQFAHHLPVLRLLERTEGPILEARGGTFRLVRRSAVVR